MNWFYALGQGRHGPITSALERVGTIIGWATLALALGVPIAAANEGNGWWAAAGLATLVGGAAWAKLIDRQNGFIRGVTLDYLAE